MPKADNNKVIINPIKSGRLLIVIFAPLSALLPRIFKIARVDFLYF